MCEFIGREGVERLYVKIYKFSIHFGRKGVLEKTYFSNCCTCISCTDIVVISKYAINLDCQYFLIFTHVWSNLRSATLKSDWGCQTSWVSQNDFLPCIHFIIGFIHIFSFGVGVSHFVHSRLPVTLLKSLFTKAETARRREVSLQSVHTVHLLANH